MTNPVACIPQPLWGQFYNAFCCAWEAEKNEDLKAALLLHSSKIKNKDLPGPGQARSHQTYAINFDTVQDDDSNDSDGYINYNICSVNQFGEPYISGYNADEYNDDNPESVLIANTATNSSSKKSKKKKQPKSILLPKPNKSQVPPAAAMRLLANQKGELCFEDRWNLMRVCTNCHS